MTCESSGSARAQVTLIAPNEHQIMFKGPMVRAILEGQKSQTRRIIKPQPEPVDSECILEQCRENGWRPWWWSCSAVQSMVVVDEPPMRSLSPYGGRGEHLWVRENWRPEHWIPGRGNSFCITYQADGTKAWLDQARDVFDPKRAERWRPSIHMPRWACRILLEVTGVRVERIRDITEEDAFAEGVPRWANSDDITNGHYLDRPLDAIWCPTCKGEGTVQALGAGMGVTEATCSDCDTARKLFRNLWDNVNASPKPVYQDKEVDHYVSYPWDGEREVREHRGRPWHVVPNPWVWVVEFKRLQKEDLVEGTK